ncbi:hypothetical protein [Pseudomonas citronellolis]|nr:hypothetical protein [Pseudomonas citronellolis]
MVEQRGSTETSDAVKLHLETLIENADAMAGAMADLAIQEAKSDPE